MKWNSRKFKIWVWIVVFWCVMLAGVILISGVVRQDWQSGIIMFLAGNLSATLALYFGANITDKKLNGREEEK